MNNLKSKYGPWALITGASSGIGEEFANRLAASGLNLVLVARNIGRLETVSTRLIQQHGIQTLVISLDLSSPDFINILLEKTALLEIGLLVSNAGGYRYGSFHKRNVEELTAFLRLNTSTHLQLVHSYGNKMKSRRRGGLVLVGSAGGFSSIPYMASYAASKAYVLSLGEALHVELKEHGVEVMVLAPGATETPGTLHDEGIDNSKLGVTFMKVGDVVEEALKNFGKKVVVVPGGLNKFSYFLSKHILSRVTMTKLLGKVMRKAMSPDII